MHFGMLIMTMLDALQVPGEFGQVEHILDKNVVARLDVWKTGGRTNLDGYYGIRVWAVGE
jgi:hypothetical protein